MNNTNWKEQVASAIAADTRIAVIEETSDGKDNELAGQLRAALDEGRITGRDRDFANSMMSGFIKFGHFTDGQRPWVAKLINPPPEVLADRETATDLREMIMGYILLGSDRDFAESMLRGFDQYGTFTERQRPYARDLVRRTKERLESAPNVVEKAPEDSLATTSDETRGVPRVEASIAPAAPAYPCRNILSLVNLDKFARLTVGPLVLSLKNDGEIIWVKWDGLLAGSITAQRGYLPSKRYLCDSTQKLCIEALLRLEEFTLEAIQESGIATGRCSCCGRALTDPVSIGFGIGPVCRARGWGIA